MNINNYTAINSFISEQNVNGVKALRVIKDKKIKEYDEPTFARLSNKNFHNGSIQVKVMSKILLDAPEFARGFIGLAFRINEDNSKFESIYIRPTNGRSNDQLRRNHSIQYFSYPEYKFDRLRVESEGVYESYADMELGEWIELKIEIKDTTANLYINNSTYPVLIVNDLKQGNSNGGVGLWVEVGTEGFFSDLVIKSFD